MKIVIIGNGVAGVSVAETVRSIDKNSEVTVITEDHVGFYSRPRLIELLAKRATIDQITIHAQDWFSKNNITLMLSTRIAKVDVEAKLVIDNHDRQISYDKLVIASGALPLVPKVPGAHTEGVFVLRTIDDALMIRQIAQERRKAVVIGGGLLGIEVANSLAALGSSVTVIEIFERLLARQLDNDGSRLIQQSLEKRNLTFLTGKRVEKIDTSSGTVRIICNGGSETSADFLVFSAGITPAIGMFKDSPIEWNSGIIVDDFMRTNVPDVYACGDCAEHGNRVYGLWQPSREQGIACGNHLCGHDAAFKGFVPSVRLKVAGIEFASIGSIDLKEGAREIVEKDGADGVYKKLFVKDGRLAGAILISDLKDAGRLQQMIKNREEIHL